MFADMVRLLLVPVGGASLDCVCIHAAFAVFVVALSVPVAPCQGSNAFKEVAIIKHPSVGEYAIGFITSTLVLRKNSGDEELCCIYVSTNHLYIGDIVLVNSKDVMRPNISVREGIGEKLIVEYILAQIYIVDSLSINITLISYGLTAFL
ncbi:COV 3-like protein [Tanacetum coccineum]